MPCTLLLAPFYTHRVSKVGRIITRAIESNSWLHGGKAKIQALFLRVLSQFSLSFSSRPCSVPWAASSTSQGAYGLSGCQDILLTQVQLVLNQNPGPFHGAALQSLVAQSVHKVTQPRSRIQHLFFRNFMQLVTAL